jgi:starvation-inducible DNA-binding protein
LPGNLVAQRSWDDYDLLRDGVLAHLGALDVVYAGVVGGHREAIEAFEQLDPVTQDMLIEQTQQLEQFHWFVRAHLEDKGGVLATKGAATEQQAATRATRRETTGTQTGANGKSKAKASSTRSRRKN